MNGMGRTKGAWTAAVLPFALATAGALFLSGCGDSKRQDGDVKRPVATNAVAVATNATAKAPSPAPRPAAPKAKPKPAATKPKQTATKPKKPTYNELPRSAVLVDVNGIKFTKKNAEDMVAIFLRLMERRNPKVTKKSVDEAERKIRGGCCGSFLRRALLESGARSKNVKPSPELIDSLKKKYAKTFGRKGDTFDRIVKIFRGDEQKSFLDLFTSDLLGEAYFQSVYSNKLAVSDATLTNQVARHVRYNRIATATNNLAYAQATNVWLKLKAGGNFAALANRHSQDTEKRPGGDIGECVQADFAGQEEGYWEAVSKLKVGEFTPPLTTDVGVEIVRRLPDLPAADKDRLPGHEAAYHLARIYWRRAVVFDIDPQIVKVEMEKDIRRELWAKAVNDRMKTAKISYPSGKEALPMIKKGGRR